MKDDEADIELIEAYLRGALNGQALAAFQKRRLDDPEFDREVTDYTQIINQIRTSHEKDFLNKLKGWENEIDHQEAVKVMPFRTLFSIAASVLVFAIAGVYVFWNSQADHEELFQEYFQPYENVISERSGGNAHQMKGMELYDQKKYDEAIIPLRIATAEDSHNPSLKCYLGIAYLATGNTQEAKIIFESLIHDDQSLFKEVAEWNLAMTYLKLDDEAFLKETLTGIVQQKDHLYSDKAAGLLRKL